VFVQDEHGALQGVVSDSSDRLSLWAVADEKEPLMSYAKQLLDTYPRDFNVDAGLLAATIDALSDCAQACTACADDCLSEQRVAELVKCIRLDLDCTDVCGHAAGAQPPDRVRCQPHPPAAAGLCGGLQELWG
jgi:hypothetical protein